MSKLNYVCGNFCFDFFFSAHDYNINIVTATRFFKHLLLTEARKNNFSENVNEKMHKNFFFNEGASYMVAACIFTLNKVMSIFILSFSLMNKNKFGFTCHFLTEAYPEGIKDSYK